jgi:peptidoglycan/LPS O-acetylase OafA/YrhL
VGLPRTVGQLSQNLALYDFQINGATWTLNVEVFGAVFLFLAYAAYRRFREFGIIFVGCIFASIYLHAFDGYFIQFRMFIYSFALGALVTTPLGRWYSTACQHSWPFLLITMIMRGTQFKKRLRRSLLD